MKEPIVITRSRTAPERERVRIELDRTDTPADAPARKLIRRNLAGEVAAEFAAARRRR